MLPFMASFRRALITPCLLLLSSCGTLLSQAAGKSGCGEDPATLPNAYSGVVLDVQQGFRYRCPPVGECTFFSPGPSANVELFLILDIPLSLALDTILLPYTVYQQVNHGNICTRGVPGPPPERYRVEPTDPAQPDGTTTVTVEPRPPAR
jgi:uncharacterized protein YceK